MKWVRAVHLWIGVFSLAYLGMFAWSSLQVSHQKWFPFQPVSWERRLTLPVGMDARDAALALRTSHGLQGDLNGLRVTPEKLSFRLAMPGIAHDVQYRMGDGAVTMKSTRFDDAQFLNRMHFTAGVWHEAGAINWYGFLSGLVSFGLLVLGASGLLLWFRMRTERLIGVVLLAISALWGLGLMMAMRVA